MKKKSKHVSFATPLRNLRQSADRINRDLENLLSPIGRVRFATMPREEREGLRDRLVGAIDEFAAEIAALDHPPADLVARVEMLEQVRDRLREAEVGSPS